MQNKKWENGKAVHFAIGADRFYQQTRIEKRFRRSNDLVVIFGLIIRRLYKRRTKAISYN